MGSNTEREAIAEAVGDALMPRLVELFQAERDATRAAMLNASEEGFSRAFVANMTEANARRIFKVGVEVLREEARIGTGRFVIGGLGKIARLAMWPFALLLIAYLIGGPNLFKTIWNALIARGA